MSKKAKYLGMSVHKNDFDLSSSGFSFFKDDIMSSDPFDAKNRDFVASNGSDMKKTVSDIYDVSDKKGNNETAFFQDCQDYPKTSMERAIINIPEETGYETKTACIPVEIFVENSCDGYVIKAEAAKMREWRLKALKKILEGNSGNTHVWLELDTDLDGTLYEVTLDVGKYPIKADIATDFMIKALMKMPCPI